MSTSKIIDIRDAAILWLASSSTAIAGAAFQTYAPDWPTPLAIALYAQAASFYVIAAGLASMAVATIVSAWRSK